MANAEHDWDALLEKLRTAIRIGEIQPSMTKAARYLGVNRNTLINALNTYEQVRSTADLKKWAARPDEGVFESLDDLERLEDETDGNYRVIESYSTDLIKTMDDLVRACKIDLEEWVITHPDVRAWPVAMKLKRADGTDEPVVVQLHYVGAKLVRRNPVALEPAIQPVVFEDADAIPRPRTSRKKVKRALIIADPQVGFRRRLHTAELTPFHDRRVLDMALQILQSDEFEMVQYIGDMLDMSEWSTKFVAEPEFYWTTQPALIELAWWLRQYRKAAPHAEMDYYEGNHDGRPETAITSHLRAAYGIRPVDELELAPSLSVPRLLALHQLHINYIGGYPDSKRWLNKNVLVRHGHVVRAGPGDTAKAVANKYRYVTVFGHIHRREMVTVRMQTHEGDSFATGFCPGCACHIDGRVPGSDSEAQWQQGLGVIEFTEDVENIIPIAITEGRAVYQGQVFEARPLDGQIDNMLFEKLHAMEQA